MMCRGAPLLLQPRTAIPRVSLPSVCRTGRGGGMDGHTHVKSTAEWQDRTSFNKNCAVVFLLDGHQPDLSINKHVHPETFLRTP